jgi:hypothetical protein
VSGRKFSGRGGRGQRLQREGGREGSGWWASRRDCGGEAARLGEAMAMLAACAASGNLRRLQCSSALIPGIAQRSLMVLRR